MLRKSGPIAAIILLLCVVKPGTAIATGTDDGALKFIPKDAPIVMALDVDQLMDYFGDVGDGWRDADTARFIDSLGVLSDKITLETGKPDIFTFFGHLNGLQSASIDPEGGFPLLVLSAGSERDMDVLVGYTASYMVEKKFSHRLRNITDALNSYHGRVETDEETGKETYPGDYPATLDDLVEFGYLEKIPINPYTGEPMRVLAEGEEGSLGDIMYVPRTTCCADDSESESEDQKYSYYILKSWHITGVLTRDGWDKSFESYDDIDSRMRDFAHDFKANVAGGPESGGFSYKGYEEKGYAIAYGDGYLLFGSNIDTLKQAVSTYLNGDGFAFDEVDGFDKEGSFYFEQTDFPALYETYGPLPLMAMRSFGAGEMGLPDEIMGMIEGMYNKMGFNELGKDYKACKFENGDLVSVERMLITGDAEGTMISRILTSPPEDLLTAEGGPFDIIGELAWANPDEYAKAYIDFILESVLPLISEQMGSEEMDPGAMLGMLGLSNIEEMNFGDQLYMLVTSSEERSNGEYIPGITTLLKTDNQDLMYVVVGLMDTLSLMVPEFPFSQLESNEENIYTWTLNVEELPFTPTIGWTDGWIVKGLWKEDVLAALDAIDNGTMFMPDMMEPANSRLHVHRQELLRGIADIVYLVPEDEASLVAGVFELMALLSDPDERLYCETKSNGEWVETRSEFSIDVFEEVMPLVSYLIQGIGAID